MNIFVFKLSIKKMKAYICVNFKPTDANSRHYMRVVKWYQFYLCAVFIYQQFWCKFVQKDGNHIVREIVQK